MKTYALDTNIISYALNKNIDIQRKILIESANGNIFSIPPIVYYEIKRGLVRINAKTKLEYFDVFCKNFGVGSITPEMLDKAVEIHVDLSNKGTPIEDADILIAAFCVVNDYTLVTNNMAHFERVVGLTCVNWI